MRPGVEKWQGNFQPYPNAAIPPQHFDVWRGAPVNNHQRDIWFRGPPNGPPFATPVAPGGFPIDPFPFYRPHIPPAGLANPPHVPPPGSGPRGHHKNGEVYRPHMPDAYIPPGMPLRPGFFPGPMAFEGYYGPPMGYCNSNERDVPFMGMVAGASVYNRSSSQNPPEPGNSHGRSDGPNPAVKPLTSEPVESSRTPDTVGPYRVLLKQHNEWDGKNEPTNREDLLTTNASFANVRDKPTVSVQDNDQSRNMEMELRRTNARAKEASSQTSGYQGSSSVNNAKSLESTGSFNRFDNISARKTDGVASNMLEISSRPSSAPKDSSLIQKIEGLNAKARDNLSTKSKEERRNKFHAGSLVENEVNAGVVFSEATLATEAKNPAARGVGAFEGEKNFESSSFSGTATSRHISHGMQGRGNHRKGRLDTQDADGWRKKSGVIYSSTTSGTQLDASNILVGEHQISVDAYERSGSNSLVRREGESTQTSADSHAQHAKTKELAKQRTKQLQEEEVERTKKQKAKSLVKLDEVNRRMQTVKGSTQKEYDANYSLEKKQEEFQPSETATVLGKSGAADSSVVSNDNVACQISDTNTNRVEKPPILSSETPLETLKNADKEPVLNQNQNQSVTLYPNDNSADAADALQVHNNVASKQKRMGYKQKHNLSLGKTLNVSTTSTAPKVENDTAACVNESSGFATNEVSSAFVSGLPMNSTSMVESSVNQKRKNNRNSKNKQKVEEISSLAALPTAIPKETNLPRSSVENKPREDIGLDHSSLQSSSLSRDPNQYSEQRYSENEESYGRMNSQLKSQHSRRTPRNLQANRQAEKSHGSDVLMWAPVKPPNKIEIVNDSSDKSKIEVIVPAKNDQQVHNLKNKRAEMERYIPKPVAKEMAQQVSLQQMVSSISLAPTDDCVERVDSCSQGPQISQHTTSAVGKMGSGMESKNGDSRKTRAWKGKSHGSWRQRNLTESTDVHDMQDGVDHGSNSYQNIQIPMEHQQFQKSETSLLKGQKKHVNDTSKPDSSNNPNNHDSAFVDSVPIIEDPKATVRERQVPFRGLKGTRVNHDVDQKKNAGDTGKTETLSSLSEHNQPDVNAVLKESRSTGERISSHWQPKFQASNTQRGNRPKKKESTHAGASFQDGQDKESSTHVAQPPSQLVFEKSKGGDPPNLGNPDAVRESRNAPPKGHPHSTNQVAVSSNEQAPTGMDPRHQQRPSSGGRRNGNQNRFGKGHESQGDWKTAVQDNRYHHDQPANRERQGPNFHNEYQSVGPHGGDSQSDNFERPKDGNYHAGGRFRDRGQTHSRRGGGNFSGR
ncbi:protein MODIFIER OF SNC1 1-like [Cicer arietinum]|uniref:Protein MODIFIER OF SNC1 1-like n=1 Tax=Cicer arietinum TaxID=3827 RepID=A0A3Q7XS78_CICAR|nr:protein MODIFIER OF SNC1 1-like [Cicer arietinum]